MARTPASPLSGDALVSGGCCGVTDACTPALPPPGVPPSSAMLRTDSSEKARYRMSLVPCARPAGPTDAVTTARRTSPAGGRRASGVVGGTTGGVDGTAGETAAAEGGGGGDAPAAASADGAVVGTASYSGAPPAAAARAAQSAASAVTARLAVRRMFSMRAAVAALTSRPKPPPRAAPPPPSGSTGDAGRAPAAGMPVVVSHAPTTLGARFPRCIAGSRTGTGECDGEPGAAPPAVPSATCPRPTLTAASGMAATASHRQAPAAATLPPRCPISATSVDVAASVVAPPVHSATRNRCRVTYGRLPVPR